MVVGDSDSLMMPAEGTRASLKGGSCNFAIGDNTLLGTVMVINRSILFVSEL